MWSGILGSYGLETSGTSIRPREFEVRTSPEQPFGMTALQRLSERVLVCCYGDLLVGAPAPPDDTDFGSWQRWMRSAMLRGCGAVCSADSLVLWTDESAICPIFFAFDRSGQPVFATEAKTLATLVPGALRFALTGCARPLPAIGRTIFEGIRSVPPGRVLELRRDRARWYLSRSTPYFNLPTAHLVDSAEARSLVKNQLEKSVQRAVEGTTELGVPLSGGVDSSSVAMIAKVMGARLDTFTVGSLFGNEFAPAADVAELLGSRHHEFVMTLEDLQDLLPDLVQSLETWDPLTIQIAAPMAFLYRRISGQRAILLSGYGADLLFAGVANQFVSERKLEQQVLEQVRLTVATNEFSPSPAVQHGVTVRYPYWSPSMLTTGLSIRGRLKVRDGEVKHVLRSAAESWLPPKVAWRKKMGIHEGSSMHRMFTECLGVPTLAEQQIALRDIAQHVLLDIPPAVVAARTEVAPCMSF
jgi:carbapenam-3-carboxylate synthase